MNGIGRWFARLPTPGKLLLILTAALLPIGLGLVWVAESGIQDANGALAGRTEDQAHVATGGIESLIARDALALRIAANGALVAGDSDACARVQRSLSIAPAVSQQFAIEGIDGKPICAVGDVGDISALPLVAPGSILLRIAPDRSGILVRTGLANGMATSIVRLDELRRAVAATGATANALTLSDPMSELPIVARDGGGTGRQRTINWPIASDQLTASVRLAVPHINAYERIVILLPVLMWIIAALMSWLLVTRLLVRPLRQLQRSVLHYQPGDGALDLPRKLGPATEIQGLRDAFERAVTRVDESERNMTGALEGQRRLVREVHHRVKNNLQVVASLLSIHGRSAGGPEATAAYAAIGRRVGALSVVHRNHFAEMEDNRGIALRPLLTELAAELRSGAPGTAHGLSIDLDLAAVFTTQDVAVSVAFLVTEMVEFAMLNCPGDAVDIALRRTSELTARLELGSPVLVPDEAGEASKVQFERIVTGLAKQLRSPLDRKLGRYSVDLPVFPPS